MSWSKGVVLALVLFALYMMYFLVRAILSGSESVPTDYYEKGNDYQQELNGIQIASSMGLKPTISYISETNEFEVGFDSIYADSGRLEFQWPPDKRQNFSIKMGNFHGQPLIFKKEGKVNGFWNAELIYFKNGKSYRHVQKVWTE